MPGVCPRCLREVYFAEEKLALGKVWHTFCFSCRNCRKLLDSRTVATHSGELYCRNCHNRLFSITSVRATVPGFVEPTFDRSANAEDPTVSTSCESLFDRRRRRRCCCCCNDEYALIEARNGQSKHFVEINNFSGEKSRLRAVEDEQIEINSLPITTGDIAKLDSDNEDSQIDAQSFVTTLCDPIPSPNAITSWYNGHHSASQSTLSRPSSAQRSLTRPYSTPASAENVSKRDPDGCRCARNGGPSSPRRTNNKHRVNGQSSHRHYHRDFHTIDQILHSREREKFVNNDIAATKFSPTNNRMNLSFEHSSDEERSKFFNEPSSSNRPIEDSDDVEDSKATGDRTAEERSRMRGGSGCCCGGGGGSGNGPTRANVTFDRRNPSPCGQRYQSDRSSTVEGACGCNGQQRSECGVAIAGGCCSTDGKTSVVGNSSRTGGCCSSTSGTGGSGCCASNIGSGKRTTGFETCPPRSPDPCSPDPTDYSPCSAGACSPPCSGRKGCCPPAGCRPVRRTKTRCASPCTGDNKNCGGGGCCGGGCRGGCGKPGQTCLPLRPCTIPPCKVQPRAGGSPCVPPRGCPPEPPCCRNPVVPGTGSGYGSGCCRSASPGGRSAGGGGCSSPNRGCQRSSTMDGIGSCCQPKLPSGCECLGGGQDCQRCGRKVYQAEMQIASGVPYHNICFSCFCCRKPLETLTYHENCGEIYCKQCYVRNFGPQGYGYAGVLQTPM